MTRRPPSSTPTYTLFPYPTLFRSGVVDRHTALRSGFHWDLKDHPFQVVHRLSALPIARHDWNGAANWRAQLDALLAPDRDQAFDIKKPPLMRLARSEEHTSELQSLMRISYAVFCLKKQQN